MHLVLALFLACGAPAPDPKGVALPAPWGTLALPVGVGEVIEVTPQVVQVNYPAGSDATAITQHWKQALEAGGFQVESPVSMGPAKGYQLRRAGEVWALFVVSRKDRVEVHLDAEG